MKSRIYRSWEKTWKKQDDDEKERLRKAHKKHKRKIYGSFVKGEKS